MTQLRLPRAPMFSMILIASGILGCANTSAGGDAKTLGVSFEDSPALPTTFRPTETDGNGTPAQWKVESDPTSPFGAGVLVVHTANLEKTYNVCPIDGFTAQDLDVSVAVKALSGTDDQGGGLVWRYQDAKNYYLTRWNPLEKNIRLYVVKDGVRSKFGDKEVDVAPGWHTISVSMEGEAILVMFNGERVIEASNDMIRDAGRVGLWTKADATSAFDGLHARDRR